VTFSFLDGPGEALQKSKLEDNLCGFRHSGFVHIYFCLRVSFANFVSVLILRLLVFVGTLAKPFEKIYKQLFPLIAELLVFLGTQAKPFQKLLNVIWPGSVNFWCFGHSGEALRKFIKLVFCFVSASGEHLQ